jgi:hypothetical protein
MDVVFMLAYLALQWSPLTQSLMLLERGRYDSTASSQTFSITRVPSGTLGEPSRRQIPGIVKAICRSTRNESLDSENQQTTPLNAQ